MHGLPFPSCGLRAADLARRLYSQGLTDFLTVRVAEQSVFTSQDALAQTQRDVALQLVALYEAAGGGWEAAAPAAATARLEDVTARAQSEPPAR